MAGAKGGHPVRHRAPDRVIVSGSFVCADTAAPTTIYGDGFTVSAPSTGAYTITLTDGPYAGVDAIWVGLCQATGGNDVAILIGDPQVDIHGGTFQVETQSSAGTPANLTGGPEVHFILILRNTSVGRRAG